MKAAVFLIAVTLTAATNPDGTTDLHWAVHQDDIDSVRRLLNTGANAKAANRFGVTPLSEACINGNGAMVALLLKAGADANGTLPSGETMLMLASRTGRVEAVRAQVLAVARARGFIA